jgi:hypothetical protein
MVTFPKLARPAVEEVMVPLIIVVPLRLERPAM